MKKQKREFDPLFIPTHDWQFNACLDRSPDPLENYTMGYKEAVNRLVSTILETRDMQDVLIYPICFLYRQYIELRLKEIIRSGHTLLGDDKGFETIHTIHTLYQTVKEIIKKVCSNKKVEPPDLSFVDHIITEYSRIDPKSYSFRYPFDKSGKKYLEGITHINVRHLSENIAKFGKEIDDISFTISVYLDQKREFSEL